MSKTITDDRELLQVRLWARVKPFNIKSNDCAVWGAHTLPAGYGTLQDPRTGKPIYAHRLSWELIHGPIPEGNQTHLQQPFLCSTSALAARNSEGQHARSKAVEEGKDTP